MLKTFKLKRDILERWRRWNLNFSSTLKFLRNRKNQSTALEMVEFENFVQPWRGFLDTINPILQRWRRQI